MDDRISQVLEFWTGIGPQGWFAKNDEVDAQIRERFHGLYEEAAAGKLEGWRSNTEGCLALVLVLDQFPRNMFRDDPRAFATDARAVEIASAAIADGHHLGIGEDMLAFIYMPFMHSESILDQRRCVALMHGGGKPDNLKYAIIHHDVIARFGRFPHRNSLLGRHTTPAEQAYLDGGGFSG